ncbi:MAG TPA: MBL fold metallo-hydrolase [Gammaproteobacteria bacterium]
MKADPVANGIYMLHARGGNVGAVIGPDGIFLVDDQLAPLTGRIRGKLDELPQGKGKPVRFVLNTHFHGDHTGGNENLGRQGAVIVAHDNVRKRMTADEFRENFLAEGGKDIGIALPVVTFNDRVTFHVNGHTLATRHYPHAHTDSDSVVWFREANAVHMGDIYFQRGYPFIDIDHGGSVDGVIAAVDAVLVEADGDTVVMPGHGKLSDADELREYRDMLVALRDKVAAQIKAGKNRDAVNGMMLSQPYDERWSWSFIDGRRFIDTLYRDLSRAAAEHRAH